MVEKASDVRMACTAAQVLASCPESKLGSPSMDQSCPLVEMPKPANLRMLFRARSDGLLPQPLRWRPRPDVESSRPSPDWRPIGTAPSLFSLLGGSVRPGGRAPLQPFAAPQLQRPVFHRRPFRRARSAGTQPRSRAAGLPASASSHLSNFSRSRVSISEGPGAQTASAREE